MEFKTTQGGETTLHFDEAERDTLLTICMRQQLTSDQVIATITRLRQANPLADFSELVALAYPSAAGVVPAKKAKAVPPPDPNVALEQEIRRRLAAGANAVGSTSQSQQAEALLLGALATCLQTRTLTACLAEIEMTVRNGLANA